MKFKDRAMSSMQNFARAMFMPVLILPIVGLLIAVANLFTNASLIQDIPFLNNPVTIGFGTILSGCMQPILSNLGLIFAVGVSIGLAKEKKSDAAFISVLTYVVFLNAMNKYMNLRGLLAPADALRGTGQSIILGVQVLEMGAFLGIILGLVVAAVHNRFINTEFKGAFQIYGSARFVFIVMIPVTILLAVVCTHVWPPIQSVISKFGTIIGESGNLGYFLFGASERLLIPVGLHNVLNPMILYTSLGGSAMIDGVLVEGARNITLAELASPNVATLSTAAIFECRGVTKIFGLTGAALAMYQAARPENKQRVKSILVPVVLTSCIAGITEPIEFSFLFVAPVLYVVHAILSGAGLVLANLLGARTIAYNGIIDFILYNVPAGINKTHWPAFLLAGVIMFVVYYVVFYFLITKLNLHTLGREDEGGEMKLYSKKEYKEKQAKEKQAHANAAAPSGKIDAATIVAALGGKDNLLEVDNCFTRLRLKVKDNTKIDQATLKNQTGASGVMIKGQIVQVIYGLKINAVRRAVDEELSK